MPISIRDVARRAGVSHTTVSRVFGSDPAASIAESTRQRVENVAAEMGYRPNLLARALNGKAMNAIGIVFAEANMYFATSPFFAAVLDGVVEVMTEQQQNLMLFTGAMWANAEQSLPLFSDRRTDGLLLISPPENSDMPAALMAAGIPFVVVDSEIDSPDIPSVSVDNAAAAEEMTTYLIAQGHERIAMLCGFASVGSVARRLAGYRRALAKANLTQPPGRVLPGTYTEASGYERAVLLMGLPPERRPTALFCGNDQIALGALRALEEQGLRVPEEISVTGFDDIPAAAISRPPLTTVRQPMRELGRRAAERLLQRIHTGSDTPKAQEILPTERIVRATVGSVP